MKKYVGTILMIVALFSSSIVQARDDEQGIKDLVNRFTDAWNRHDAKAMAATWTEGGDVINPAGRYARGRSDIEKLAMDEHTGAFRSSSLAVTITSIRFVKNNLAFVDCSSHLMGVHWGRDKASSNFDHHLAFLAERRKGKWYFVSARPYAFIKTTISGAAPAKKSAKPKVF